MRLCLAASVTVQLAVVATAGAQHPHTTATSTAGIESCRLCHSTHEGAPGSAGLVTGEDRGQSRWLEMYAPGAGPVTLSCLRCHLTEAERVRQPEFSYMAPLTGQGTFIGTDLGNDHPLGSMERLSMVPRVDLSDPRQMRPTDLSLAARHTVIECTTCHDPHDRVSGKPDAMKQRDICGSCHDPATYQYEGHSDQACSECHAMHGAARQTLLADQDASRLCGRCHLADSPLRAADGTARGSARLAPVPRSGEGHELGGDCLACHGGHQR